MRQRFREVTDELRALSGSPPSPHMYGNVMLTVDGVSFSLMHDSEDAGHMVMFCDFGAPKEESRSEVIKALLSANSAGLAHAGRESFCMNPVSGHILASSILPLPQESARLLFGVLRQYAEQARQWQHAYALRTDTGAPQLAS